MAFLFSLMTCSTIERKEEACSYSSVRVKAGGKGKGMTLMMHERQFHNLRDLYNHSIQTTRTIEIKQDAPSSQN